jgi:hypothetical protein
MSDTFRHVDYGWGPGDPDFDRWQEHQPEHKKVRSKKHQARDRDSLTKDHRFTKGVKNSRGNLKEKIYQMKAKEEVELLNDG